jgi:TPR repeat protein
MGAKQSSQKTGSVSFTLNTHEGNSSEDSFKEARRLEKTHGYNSDPFLKNRVLNLYKNAIENGNTAAMNRLGYNYYMGFGVEQNLDTAEKYYRMAIEKGDEYVLVGLGIVLHAQGMQLSKQNKLDESKEKINEAIMVIEEAIEKYKKKETEDKGLCAQAKTSLGTWYLYGMGVEKDNEIGIELLKDASTVDVVANINLGLYYYDSNDVDDLNKSIIYFTNAKEKGEHEAIGYLQNAKDRLAQIIRIIRKNKQNPYSQQRQIGSG